MAGFPPKTGGNAKPLKPYEGQYPTSTGKGGIKASLKVKNAGTHDAPGKDKTVQEF